MKITFTEYLTPTEEEIIELGKKAGLTEIQIETMWSDLREIPVNIEYDVSLSKVTIK